MAKASSYYPLGAAARLGARFFALPPRLGCRSTLVRRGVLCVFFYWAQEGCRYVNALPNHSTPPTLALGATASHHHPRTAERSLPPPTPP